MHNFFKKGIWLRLIQFTTPVVIVALVFVFIGGKNFVESATFTVPQSSWVVGESTDIATHDPVNGPQQGWRKYTTKSANVIVDDTIKLDTVSSSWMQSTAADFNSAGSSHNSTIVLGDSVTVQIPTSPIILNQTNDSNTVATNGADGGWGSGTADSNITQFGAGSNASIKLKSEPIKTIVYATEYVHNGDFGSTASDVRSEIDGRCASDANKPSGTLTDIKAFLSVSGSDEVRDMQTDAGGSYASDAPIYWYKESDNSTAIFASSWMDMLDGSISTHTQEQGTGKAYDVWSSGNGGTFDSSNSCNGWTEQITGGNLNDANYGAYNTTSSGWLNAGTVKCNTQQHLRCVANYNENKVKPSGTYTAYLDAGSSTAGYGWTSFDWSGSYAGDSNVSFKVKSSDNTTVDFSSGTCDISGQEANGAIGDLSGCTNNTHQYLHYQVILNASTGNNDTPVIDRVSTHVDVSTGQYSSSGKYTSQIFNTGITHQGIEDITYNVTKPSNTSVTMKVRSCSTAGCTGANDKDFSTCLPVSSGQDLSTNSCIDVNNTYLQYQIELHSNPARTEAPALNEATIHYKTYATNTQSLVSSKFDSSTDANIIAGVSWVEGATMPNNTKVAVSIRTAATAAGVDAAQWVEVASSSQGSSPLSYATSPHCSKSGGTVTCTAEAIPTSPINMRDAQDDRYHQYKIELTSTNGEFTPTVQGVNVKYVINDPPEFNPDYPNSGAGGVSIAREQDETISISYSVRDTDTDDGVNHGFVTPSFQYSTDGGSTWIQVTTGLGAGATTTKAVSETSYNTYSTTWDPKQQIPETYNASMQVRVAVDDGEGANNIASAYNASPFVLDIKKPVFAQHALVLDASGYPGQAAHLSINATDDTGMQMKVGLNSNLAGSNWEAFNTDKNISLSTYPQTLFVQVRDAYGNMSSIQQTTTVTRPTLYTVQDVSNHSLSAYALFVSWEVSGIAQSDFAKYEIYRTENSGSWPSTPIKTITDTEQNYYRDGSLVQHRQYFYKVLTTDKYGNISAYSVPQSGTPAFGAGSSGEPPSISSVIVTPASITANSATITWHTDVPSDSVVQYVTTTGGDFSNAQSAGVISQVTDHSVTLYNLTPETPYYIKVESTGGNGVTGSYKNGVNGDSFTTLAGQVGGDTTRPIITLNGPNPVYLVVGDTYTEQGATASDDTDGNLTASIVITGGPVVTTTAHTYTLKYNVQDAALNNAVEKERVVIVNESGDDTQAPIIFTDSIHVTKSTTDATIGWTTNENATTILEWGLDAAHYGSPVNVGTLKQVHSIHLTGLATSTNYVYRIKHTDATGNEMANWFESSFTTAADENDTTPPNIQSIVIDGLGATVATISWTTNEPTKTTLAYGTDLLYGEAPIINNDYNSGHRVELSNLTANTDYYFKIVSTDNNDNQATNEGINNHFKTLLPGALEIVAGSIEVTQGTTTATIMWRTNTNSDSAVSYASDTFYAASGHTYNQNPSTNAFQTTQHAYTINGLSEKTKYHFSVKSDNGDGGIATSSDHEFTTLEKGGVVIIRSGGGSSPPNISNIKIENITESAALVSWDTNKASDSVVEYTTSSKKIFKEAFSQGTAESVKKHMVHLKHLRSGTTYFVRVKSARGNDVGVRIYNKPFTTLGELIATTTDDDLTLDEDATPTDELSELIKKFGDGTPPDKLESSFRNIVRKIKSFLPAPIISGKPEVVVTQDSATIVWGTNKPSNSIVLFANGGEYNKDSARPYPHQMGENDVFTEMHSVEVSNLKPATLYHFKVKSSSEVGKDVLSDDLTFTTESEKPKVVEAKVAFITDMEAEVTWLTNVPTDSVVKFTPFNELLGEYDESKMRIEGKSELIKKHKLKVANLIPGTDYTITLFGENEEGVSYEYKLDNFITGKDVEPPVISSVKTESAILQNKDGDVRSIISWITDEDSIGQIAYTEVSNNKELTGENIARAIVEMRTKRRNTRKKRYFKHKSGIIITERSDDIAKEHIEVLEQLDQGKTYAFKIIAADEFENSSLGDTYVIMVPQKQKSVFDLIVNTFESRFSWLKSK